MDQAERLTLADEHSGIADQLSNIANQLRSGEEAVSSKADVNQSDSHHAVHLDVAKKAYASRRRREMILPKSCISGEPAWDILLDLYIAFAESRQISVTSACIASAVPQTTALRWLSVLEGESLVERLSDPVDQRRIMVRLTTKGVIYMEKYFSSISD